MMKPFDCLVDSVAEVKQRIFPRLGDLGRAEGSDDRGLPSDTFLLELGKC